MPTIDLGRIKPIWQGQWAGSTAYVKDDIVRHGADSYICVTAHTSHASTFSNDSANWELMIQGTDLPTQSGQSGKVLKTDGSSLSWGDSGKTKQTFWAWINTQASLPNTTQENTGLQVLDHVFTAASDAPQFCLDLSFFIGVDSGTNDTGDIHLVAWIEKDGSIVYPFGFRKTGGFRSSTTFRALANQYFIEDADSGYHSSSNDWGAMRHTWSGIMGGQSSSGVQPTAATSISAGDTLRFKIHIGGSGGAYLNRTINQTSSMSRSWWKLTEVDGNLS